MKLKSIIQELPIIESQADIDKLFPDIYTNAIDIDEREKRYQERATGKQVRVLGKYQQTNTSKAASIDPNLQPCYVGMVHIILADSAILLYPFGHPSGIRSSDEIAQFEHKRVVVVGKFVPHAGPYNPNLQGLIGPCMLTVESIVRLYPSKAILC
ncbi:hypothetical protein [Nostoc sp. DedQUE09]|uniref:hypothetical protein n=1 Tax=Nostoc sp. DedQUE09 TaxID=3075394 RepID=UPI002AD5A145|nr:hypothetical protein [Nostoc sp. DedQUE09]MDZ7952239.1 hypothetical protein [Nostoc sp. DedQUE09]